MAEITAHIIDTVMSGISDGIPLRQLARMHDFSKSAWYRLLASDADLQGRFARAREEGFDALAEEALEIAEDGTNDWETRERDDGSTYEALNHEHVSRSKLRVETRLKLLAKWDPKRYGESTMIKHADANGEKIEVDEVTRAARLAALAAEINAARDSADAAD